MSPEYSVNWYNMILAVFHQQMTKPPSSCLFSLCYSCASEQCITNRSWLGCKGIFMDIYALKSHVIYKRYWKPLSPVTKDQCKGHCLLLLLLTSRWVYSESISYSYSPRHRYNYNRFYLESPQTPFLPRWNKFV